MSTKKAKAEATATPEAPATKKYLAKTPLMQLGNIIEEGSVIELTDADALALGSLVEPYNGTADAPQTESEG